MNYYQHKDEAARAYEANKKRLRFEAQIILADMLNEALHEMTVQFKEALNNGGVLKLPGSTAELKEFLRLAAERELGPAGGRRALPGKK